jgi:hypothetical protein
MKESNKINVKISKDDLAVGYVKMPLDNLSDKTITKTIDLCDLVDNYQGIPVYLDFNKKNELVGIEICG